MAQVVEQDKDCPCTRGDGKALHSVNEAERGLKEGLAWMRYVTVACLGGSLESNPAKEIKRQSRK